MPKIEGIRVANYRVLRDVTLGKLWSTQSADPLTPMTVVIGRNGVGKSSLLDAFGFLSDCVRLGVEEACHSHGRGGFQRIRSQGSTGPIEFQVCYRQDSAARPITYELAIDTDSAGRPYVARERLRAVALDDKRRPVIATLGNLKQHPRMASVRRFLEGLRVHGDNLGNVVQFMERQHRSRFRGIVQRVAEMVPGIDSIDTARSSDGRLLLRFNDKGFEDPFYAQQVSDGTRKLFAYLLMLEDPSPSFICVKEPENGLHHKSLDVVAREFRRHSTKQRDASQFLVTTHHPHFVDTLSPNETWILEKGEDGFAKTRRASDDSVVESMTEEGLTLGSLWYSGYLD